MRCDGDSERRSLRESPLLSLSTRNDGGVHKAGVQSNVKEGKRVCLTCECCWNSKIAETDRVFVLLAGPIFDREISSWGWRDRKGGRPS